MGSSGLYTISQNQPRKQFGKAPVPGRDVINKPWVNHGKWLSVPAAWLPGPFLSVSDAMGGSWGPEMAVFAGFLK